MLIQAIQEEAAAYLLARSNLVDERGRQQVVRNGSLPAREIQTPLVLIEVRQPRVRDGALGFWSALSKVFPTTRHQRCWVLNTANVLN